MQCCQMVCLGIIVFGDLIALLETLCFLLSLKQHHYGDLVGAYENIDVNTFNMNVSGYQCYLYACICIS